MLVDKLDKARYSFLAPSAKGARGHLATGVEAALREAILNLTLEPGAMLEKQAICDQLGVSRSPVSAAMARLAEEGLVEVLPQRGTRVTRIALADIRQHLFIRAALEAETVLIIAPGVPDELLGELDANLQAQKSAAAAGDAARFHMLDLQFHEILLDAVDLPRVKAVVGTARNSLDRARRLMATPTRQLETFKEHARIVRALHAHDAERAARAMRAHLDKVAAELHRFARRRSDLFE
jgi:GntR family transcriptional regulator, rspAB operon transcriptional repressor